MGAAGLCKMLDQSSHQGSKGDSVRKELWGQELRHTVRTAAKGCHI